MNELAIVLAALGPALGQALYEVGKEVLAKPLLEPASERFKAWVRRGYDARADDVKVQEAVKAAVQVTGLAEDRDWAGYPLRAALDRLKGKGRKQGTLRKQAVAAALAMARDAPEEVPDELRQALRVPVDRRANLARFLWAFRGALVQAGDDNYRELVNLAQQDAIRDYLWTLASTVVQTPSGRRAVQVIVAPPEEREIEERYLRSLVGGWTRWMSGSCGGC